MGKFIFMVSVTGVAFWIAYYYLHIHSDCAYNKANPTKFEENEKLEPEKRNGKDFWD